MAIQGTTIGTITNEKGEYSLNVQAIVVVNYVGFSRNSKTIEIDDQKVIDLDFELTSDVLGLDEIIVTVWLILKVDWSRVSLSVQWMRKK